jgi:glycosyltransferase involved in cell wall biosynthesis
VSRPAVSFIAWGRVTERSSEIAAALGGEARCFYSLGIARRPLVPVRYLLSAAQTVGYLLRHRPRALIVTNPPIFPGLIAWIYVRLTGAAAVLDSHPGSFGLKGDWVSARFLPLHRYLVRRMSATLVTDERLANVVFAWGGWPEIVHEAPPGWRVAPPRRAEGVLRLLLVTVFDPDEPVAEVVKAVKAAAKQGGIELRITGDPARCVQAIRAAAASAPIEFTGYLRGDEYRRALEAADVVLALTTEPNSIVRAGCEAVYARRPLIVSDWRASREAFPYAVHVANDAVSIGAGIQRARAEHERLRAAADDAYDVQEERWLRQLAALRHRLRLDAHERSEALVVARSGGARA